MGTSKGNIINAAVNSAHAATTKHHATVPKIIKKLQNMPPWRYRTVMVIALCWLIMQLYIKTVGPLENWVQYPLHLCFALIEVYLLNPMVDRKAQRVWWMYDIFLIGSVVIILWFFLSNTARLDRHIEGISPLIDTDYFICLLLLVTVMEAVRRVVSTSLFIILIVFIGYAWFGEFIPGNLHHPGLDFSEFCNAIIFSDNGIFGAPLKASLNTLFYFLIFGKFFSSCGGGAVLLDLGLKLSSRLEGGPAKAAVISSGLAGMVSGSAVANVSGTGVNTIPLMKKAGYSPEEAGAIESVASTGGQLMPPIMGASAFIMAELLNVEYINIAHAAVIPAFAYFIGTYIVVHLVSKKRNIGRHTDLYIDEKPILPRLYRLIPVVVIVALMIYGFSFSRSAIICTFLSIGISLLSKDTRRTVAGYAAILLDGVRHAANIAVPTAACGMMIGVAVKTEIAFRILSMLSMLRPAEVMLIVAVVCLMLGMALPTIAAYLIAYTIFMPAIRSFGVSEIVGNMFIFYFGVVAQITPPVCPASYTAAGIAEANPWKTGWKAYSYAAVTFIVPFIFVQRPVLLLMSGTFSELIIGCGVLLLAFIWLGASVSGYMFKDLESFERILFIVAAVMFAMPGGEGLVPGLVVGMLTMMFCLIRAGLSDNST